MRFRVYIDGIPSWSANEPSHARLSGVRGSLVTGAPGPNDRDVQRKQAAYHAQKQKEYIARKKLDARPVENGRPRLSPDIELNGRGKRYATEEERIAARRQSWRDAGKRKRERKAAA